MVPEMNLSDDWRQVRNVLCIRLDAMGDVLMTTPALRALREGRDDRRLTLMTSPAGAAAGRLVPWVDDLMVYDAPWMKATAARSGAGPEFAVIDRLGRAGFDAAVIFTVYSQNPLPAAVLCYLAGIPLRLAHCRENPYQLLTGWIPDPEPDRFIRHEVRRQLDLVAAVGFRADDERMGIAIPHRARRHAETCLKSYGIGEARDWVVIHPGCSAPSRRYPAESYSEVARRLARDHGFRVVFTGEQSEREAVDAVRQGMEGTPAISLAGELDLAELAALIERAPLLVANNTGPVHIAAAVGTPVVDLYALTNPQHTPWGVPNRVLFHDVPCKYCYKSICPQGHHDCLRLVRPEDVVTAVIELHSQAEDANSERSATDPALEQLAGAVPHAALLSSWR
jgi:lipopolysaccharide heptosyltransferase II